MEEVTSGTTRPRVSVIMIFLDAEEFMEESIESVLQQTLCHWELLLVDDGSTDSSSDIACAYASQDPRIRYLEHPQHENRGMSASRNLGIAEARGELLAFLDADDIWLPEKLQRQAELLDANPRAAMVYGPTLLWYSWDRGRENAPPDRHRLLGVEAHRLYEPPALVPRFLRREAQTPSTCGVLVRRDAVIRFAGFEDVFRGMYEDQVFFYKLCLSQPVYVTSHCWDWYRQHRASASVRSESSGFYSATGPNEAHRRFLEWIHRYVEEVGAMEPVLLNALETAMWPYRHPRLWAIKRLWEQTRGKFGRTCAKLAHRLRPAG